MKTKLILSGILLLAVLTSCKEEKKESDLPTEQPKAETFDVLVDLVIKKDDDLLLFYKDGTNPWFDADHIVWCSLKGSDDVQTATFSLPEGLVLSDMRLDIGRDEYKAQEPVEIKKITLKYQDRKFEILEDQIPNFFEPNQYINYNQSQKLYSFKKDENGAYDPFLVAKSTLISDILRVSGIKN